MKYIKHLHLFSILCSILVFNKYEDDQNTSSDNTKDTVSDDTNTVPDTIKTVLPMLMILLQIQLKVRANENGCPHSQLANLSGYNYNYKNLLIPPYDGTIFISGNIIKYI